MEHETEFHDNPNYITVCFTSRANGDPAARSRDEFATIKEEKDLEEDSANFTIAMRHWSRAISYMASNNDILFSLYGNYSATIWIVMAPGKRCKFHAPSPPHKLLPIHT